MIANFVEFSKFPWATQFIAHHKSHIGHNAELQRYGASVTSSVSNTIKRDFDLRRELRCAFSWVSTHEGYDYWKTIAQSM